MKTFIDVMRRGSFAAVAKDRNQAPSSISRAIASLEDQLSLRLFQRTTRRMCPTEAGERYFELIEPLVMEMERAKQTAIDMASRPMGTLRLTTSVSFGQKCIIPLMPEFAKTHPDLTLDLHLTDTVVDLLAERIDLALRLGPLRDSSLVAHRLMGVRYIVCASSQYLSQHGCPAHPQELQHHNCLRFSLAGFRSRWFFRSKADRAETLEVPIHGKGIFSTAIALEKCALAGMGIALLPDWLVSHEIRQGNLIDLFPQFDASAADFNTAVWMVYSSRTFVPQKVKAFTEFLRARLTTALQAAPLVPHQRAQPYAYAAHELYVPGELPASRFSAMPSLVNEPLPLWPLPSPEEQALIQRGMGGFECDDLSAEAQELD